MDIEADAHRSPEEQLDVQQWKPQKAEYLIIGCLTSLSLMAALDSTVLVPALPVIVLPLEENPQLISLRLLHEHSTEALWTHFGPARHTYSLALSFNLLSPLCPTSLVAACCCWLPFSFSQWVQQWLAQAMTFHNYLLAGRYRVLGEVESSVSRAHCFEVGSFSNVEML